MQSKRLTTEPPCITEDVFEDCLATDDMLVDYFNEFLSLPTFAQPVKFNPDFGVFEVVNDAPQRLENQLKKVLHDQKPPNPIYDVIRKAKNDGQLSKKISASPVFNIDPNYNTMRLDREQAVQWIKKERLPAFLESDCYFEYRLAKLISQVEWSQTGINFIIDSNYYPWIRKEVPSPPSPEEDETSFTMKKFYVSLGQATVSQTKDWFTLAQESDCTKTTDSFTRPVASSQIHDIQHLPEMHERDDSLSDKTGLATSQSAEIESDVDFHKQPEVFAHELADNEVACGTAEPLFSQSSSPFTVLDSTRDVREQDTEEVSLRSSSESDGADSRAAWCISHKTYDAGNRNEFERFKKFIKGTLGERYWCLWMDIERLKVLKDTTRQQRQLDRMKKFYLLSSGDYFLTSEVLFRLDLLRGDQWNIKHLRRIQPEVVKPLLLYWGPRFCVTHSTAIDTASAQLKFWHTCQERPRVDIDPFPQMVSLLPLTPKSCVPRMLPQLIHRDNGGKTVGEISCSEAAEFRMRFPLSTAGMGQKQLLLTETSSGFTRCANDPGIARSRTSTPTFLKLATPDFSLKNSSRLSPILSSRQSPQRDDFSSSRKWPKSVSRDVIPCITLDDSTEVKYQARRKYTYAELLPEPPMGYYGHFAALRTLSHQIYSIKHEYLIGKSAAGSAVLGRSIMESMLQSLYLESRAGYYFTHFCEKSGNKLWKNSAYFWADLQAYHQLFYQETLHPFKICKQAQFLYATYIAPSASMDIGLHQRKKNMIYQKIDPAFEDLFDLAEEYILILLLEPWMKMVEADKYSYGKVELVEETRQLDSVYFRKLQALHQESVSKKDESTVADTGLPSCPDVLKVAQNLCPVPKESGGSNLYDLIHDKQKLEKFWVFLNEHSAGMDLMCWVDIEQFRRMLHKDKEGREEKSKDIKNKYLNKKYFFGPNSPATRQQQEQLMHSGGGWGQILHDRLPPAVLLEIQQCIQKRLEEQWLPLFLADEQRVFFATKKLKDQVKDKTEDLLSQKQEKTTRMWKHVDNKWVSSSSEIIAFRKVLLNPVTANQFQRFVSLKGDLLENGVLFWQEVQKYKDLCHSHCDDATVQNKITAIIDRFINSTVPPALQIDIPTEQAQKILEHRKELGPYIFREAQMTIFALLFKFWPKFCKFQSRLDSDEILLALERKKGKKMQKKEGKTLEERLAKLQGKEVDANLINLPSSALGRDTGMGRRPTSFSDGYDWQTSWSYSKYIEALEQERVLLKTQEDVEKNSSSFFTGTSSTSFMKARNSEKPTISPKRSVTLEKRSDPPKETESRLKSP
nr:regulator of G-protein signaling 22 [Anas platyrhynchos]